MISVGAPAGIFFARLTKLIIRSNFAIFLTVHNVFCDALSLRYPCSSTNDFSSLHSKNQSADMDKESLPDIMISPETIANLLHDKKEKP